MNYLIIPMGGKGKRFLDAGYKTYKPFLPISKNLTINNLPQGTYSCQLIKDLNNNQIWDTGDYFDHINPEPILFTEPFDMRENWDKNLIINSL